MKWELDLETKILTFNSLCCVTEMHFSEKPDSKTLTRTFYLDHFLYEYLQVPNRARPQEQHLKEEYSNNKGRTSSSFSGTYQYGCSLHTGTFD